MVGGQQDPTVCRDTLGPDDPQVGQRPHQQPCQRRQEAVDALGSPPATCRCRWAITPHGAGMPLCSGRSHRGRSRPPTPRTHRSPGSAGYGASRRGPVRRLRDPLHGILNDGRRGLPAEALGGGPYPAGELVGPLGGLGNLRQG